MVRRMSLQIICLTLSLPEMVELMVESLLSPKMMEMMVASLEESLSPVVVDVEQ